MMTGAGCVVRVKGNSKGAAYKIDKWKTGQIGNGLITIDDIQPSEGDIATPIVAVDDYRSLYRFGKNFGQIQVHGTVYLGPAKGSSNVLKSVKSAFDSLRLSSSKSPVNVSITSGYKCKAYFTTMAFGQADPNVNKVTYILQGLVAPI